MRPTTLQRDLPARLGPVVVTACLLAGCVPAPQAAPSDDGTVRIRTASSLINEGGPVFAKPGDGGNLINEGGPVFAKPGGQGQFQIDGVVVMPRYFSGELTDLTVSAASLDGGVFPDVSPSAVQPTGAFTLKGPSTSKLFFATASFNFEDTTHTVRALAKADSASRITIDTASTLLSAKVALAEQKRHLFTIDYQETQDLSGMVRTRLGEQLNTLRLDAANEELSTALDVLAARDNDLSQRLVRWEFTLDPSLAHTPDPIVGSPHPASSGSSQSTTGTAGASPSPGAPPVK